MGDTPWYREAFRSDYRRVYGHRNLEAALGEVQLLIDCGVRGDVLDLCCGFGRHTLALRRRGVRVFGLDLSLDLLSDSTSLPEPEPLHGRLFQADATRLPLVSGSFDSVVNLFSSFGYFGAEGDARMLDEVARVLRPEGLAVFDLMNARLVRERLVPESTREEPGFRLRESRRLEDGGQRVVKEVEFQPTDGPARAWREDVRIYELEEMRTQLAERGLEVTAVYGGFDGSAFENASERMILCARRGDKGPSGAGFTP